MHATSRGSKLDTKCVSKNVIDASKNRIIEDVQVDEGQEATNEANVDGVHSNACGANFLEGNDCQNEWKRRTTSSRGRAQGEENSHTTYGVKSGNRAAQLHKCDEGRDEGEEEHNTVIDDDSLRSQSQKKRRATRLSARIQTWPTRVASEMRIKE